MWTKQEVTDAIRKATSKVAKADDPADATRAAAIQALGNGDTAKLETVLRQLYGDAALQGTHEAAHAAGGSIVASLRGVTTQLPADYWDQWRPGFGDAAAKDADGGLARLLDDAGQTIKGIEGTRLDELGQSIAEGIARGDSVQTIAGAIFDQTSGANQAFMIADTETARAMTAANLDTYQQAGVGQVEWLAEDDACPECSDLADGSPYDLDSLTDSPPLHPICRCALSPVVS